jgi:hypothetical protein
MIKIENQLYVLKQDLDDILLTNLTNDNLPFALDFQSKNNLDYYKEISLSSVPTLFTIVLNTKKDGRYRIRIGETVAYFSQYKNVRNETVKAVRRALCDCGCTDCSRCEDKEGNIAKRNQALYALLNGYTNLVKPFSFISPQPYNNSLFNFYQDIFNRNNLKIECSIANQLLETQITGNPSTNQILTNYNTAVFYLGLYFYYKYTITTSYSNLIERETQLKYLEKVFNYNTIQNCISKLGICIKEYEAVYEEVEPPTPTPTPEPEPEPEPVIRPFVIGINPFNTTFTGEEGQMLTCVTVNIGEGVSVVSYVWELLSFPSAGELTVIDNGVGLPNQALLDLVSAEGGYNIKVTATNNMGQIAIANSTLIYEKRVPVTVFTIDAGVDQVKYVTSFTNVNASIVSLGGGTSVVSYLWELFDTDDLDAPMPTIVSPSGPSTAITVLESVVTYTFKVTAINNIGQTAVDYVDVFIYPTSEPTVFTVVAFEDKVVEDNTTTLKSYTQGGLIGEDGDTFSWVLLSSTPDASGNPPIIQVSTAQNTSVSNLLNGTEYIFEVTATSNMSTISTSQMVVTVIF